MFKQNDFNNKLERLQSKELNRLFPLVKELFEFAEKKGVEGLSEYLSEDEKSDEGIIELPDKFLPLIAEYPGKYFLVGYENRKDRYYKEGTRSRYARISTVPKKMQSDKKIREIEFEDPDGSDGNRLLLSVIDSFNNKQFADYNEKGIDQVEVPVGDAKVTYEVGPNGEKKKKEAFFHRIDEGIFIWKGEKQPVRLTRSLRIAKENEIPELSYRDFYMFGRLELGKGQEHARVNIKIQGALENPSSVLVEIGVGSPDFARVIFEDEEKNISILEHDDNHGNLEDQIEIVKRDPSYSDLFQDKVEAEKIVDLACSKIRAIQEDWDKPESIFQKNSLAERERELGK